MFSTNQATARTKKILAEYNPALNKKYLFVFFFIIRFLIEEAISHSEIICIEISIICMISILIVFFPK